MAPKLKVLRAQFMAIYSTDILQRLAEVYCRTAVNCNRLIALIIMAVKDFKSAGW